MNPHPQQKGEGEDAASFVAGLNDVGSLMEGDADNDDDDVEKQQQEEILEIRKKTQKETVRVRKWRWTVTALLVVTAVAVTVSTYYFLAEEEYNNFKVAFEQFSRSVGDAAVTQQEDLRDAMVSFANTISISAENNNATWPFFRTPKFQLYAQDFMRISSAEFASVNNFVKHEDRDRFVDWSNQHSEYAIQASHQIAYGNLDLLDTNPARYNPFVSRKNESGVFVPDVVREYYHVRTDMAPPPRAYGPVTNINIASIGANQLLLDSVLALGNETLANRAVPLTALPPDEHKNFHLDNPKGIDYPHSFFHHPIHKVANDLTSDTVATLSVVHAWDVAMRKLLPESVTGIYAVLQNNCNQVFTFVIDGHDVDYLGEEDMHDSSYDDMKHEVNLTPHTHPGFTEAPGHCSFILTIYPSDDLRASYNTKIPEIFAGAVAATFVLVVVVFFVYDVMVKKRNDKLVTNAAQSNALVSNLFPGMLRDRVLNERAKRGKHHKGRQTEQGSGGIVPLLKSRNSLDAFLHSTEKTAHSPTTEDDEEESNEDAPLADHYPETTVMFGDIVGFTSWSSTRTPEQVFRLLETIYGAFDKIAKRRQVFKVETVGDCYVAVAGLPNPLPDHACAMARFANDCLTDMRRLTKDLELTLGPGTGDLILRVGLHSGPVIAGVLRGERARFQLFGDTMNTASRMESTSSSGRIQVSECTARLLREADKEHWITPRRESVVAKGKGTMRTYWLSLKPSGSRTCSDTYSGLDSSTTRTDDDVSNTFVDDQTKRLVEWDVNLLLVFIEQIVAERGLTMAAIQDLVNKSNANDNSSSTAASSISMPVEEVSEFINFLGTDDQRSKNNLQAVQDAKNVQVPKVVIGQLTAFVTEIASLYDFHGFHNFDHASHVAVSVVKLMSRIAAPPQSSDGDELPDLTFSITADPLTKFACVFAALVHDVDHSGVPNGQLAKENPELAAKYGNQSVAEQHSFDLAWDLFVEGPYQELRATLFADSSDLSRFRQLVVNCIMATDLARQDIRNSSWEKTFGQGSGGEQSSDIVNRKATLVIELLVQAADISHTMQDWHVYRKWNKRLFKEMYNAYMAGRATQNPADSWFQGELDFFDLFVIPLATKLKDCGVFQNSGDEFLRYATRNRQEWEIQGKEAVDRMLKDFQRKGQS